MRTRSKISINRWTSSTFWSMTQVHLFSPPSGPLRSMKLPNYQPPFTIIQSKMAAISPTTLLIWTRCSETPTDLVWLMKSLIKSLQQQRISNRRWRRMCNLWRDEHRLSCLVNTSRASELSKTKWRKRSSRRRIRTILQRDKTTLMMINPNIGKS